MDGERVRAHALVPDRLALVAPRRPGNRLSAQDQRDVYLAALQLHRHEVDSVHDGQYLDVAQYLHRLGFRVVA